MQPPNEKDSAANEILAGGTESSGHQVNDDSDLTGLLFETSPYGNLDAIVQHDGRVVYFYLNGDETFGTRACWVRNLVAGPYVLNQDELEQGVPPLMPKTHCRSSHAMPIPDAQSLRIVWLEEGNGAALFENYNLLAMIPAWSGVDGFHGYSHECVAESPLAWPMMENKQLRLRIENAKQFWHECSIESEHPFAKLQPNLLSVYRKTFGAEGQYFSMDGGAFPPRGASIFRNDNELVIATVGMSFRPQPNVEMAVESPADLRRVELAIKLPLVNDNSELQDLLERLSGLVAYPWRFQTWFGHGNTCGMSSLTKWFGDDHDSAVFVTDRAVHSTSPIQMPEFRGDPIQLLWLTPITSEQAQQVSKRETSIEQLLSR